MAMETRSATISTGVQNVQRTRENTGTSEVGRRGGAAGTALHRVQRQYSKFRVGYGRILSKISENQQESTESLSPILKALIDIS